MADPAEQHSITVEETNLEEYRKKLSRLEVKSQAASEKVEGKEPEKEEEGTMRFLKKIPQA